MSTSTEIAHNNENFLAKNLDNLTVKDEKHLKRKEICKQLYQVCIQPTDTFKFDTTFMQIWELLEQLNEIEADIPFCCGSERNENSFENFLQFLKDNKINIGDKFIVERYGQSDFGLKSNKDFKKADLVFEIPRSMILASSDALDSPLEDLIKYDKLLSIMPNVTLAIFILYLKISQEKKDSHASKWSPYLNILPSEFHTPLYFNLDEIKMLQPVQSFNDILLHIRNIARQYAYLFNYFENQAGYEELKSKFSFRNYKWSVSVVSTRQNQIIGDDKRPILSMIPLLDMCNHEDGDFCTDFDDEKLTAKCYAGKDIKKGEQITIFYGRRNNHDFLIHNGFVMEDNKYNSFKLKLGISFQDSLYDIRTSVLAKFGIGSTESFEIQSPKHNEKPIPNGVYYFVKVFLLKTGDELKKLLNEKEDMLDRYCKKNKLKSNEEIKKFLKMRLTILSKSYEKYINQNNQYDLNAISTNKLFALRFINSEYEIVKSAIEYLN